MGYVFKVVLPYGLHLEVNLKCPILFGYHFIVNLYHEQHFSMELVVMLTNGSRKLCFATFIEFL